MVKDRGLFKLYYQNSGNSQTCLVNYNQEQKLMKTKNWQGNPYMYWTHDHDDVMLTIFPSNIWLQSLPLFNRMTPFIYSHFKAPVTHLALGYIVQAESVLSLLKFVRKVSLRKNECLFS